MRTSVAELLRKVGERGDPSADVDVVVAGYVESGVFLWDFIEPPEPIAGRVLCRCSSGGVAMMNARGCPSRNPVRGTFDVGSHSFRGARDKVDDTGSQF